MIQNIFTLFMYGETLRKKRQEAGLSQERLAELVTSKGHRVTGAMVSMIERGYDKTKSGDPTRVNKEFVKVAADVLGWDVNDALICADYAPLSAGFLFRINENTEWNSLTPAQQEAVKELTLTTIRSLAAVSKEIAPESSNNVPHGTLKLGKRKTKTG
jgi:transcriptional regulator with XRE-family HTH domain